MIPYMGGKSNLARWIIDNFPKDYVNMLYVEPFGGGGWVLFKKAPSVNEVYNDAHKELVNLFWQIRDNYRKLKHKVEWTFHSRAMFDEAKTEMIDPGKVKSLDRALFYLILKAQSFSSNEQTYGYILAPKHRAKWASMNERITKIRERMLHVNIECADFQKIFERYDSKQTLFYCDPPYVDKEYYYKAEFKPEDHDRLFEVLLRLKGKFLLSYYPHERIDRYYKHFRVIEKKAVKMSCGVTKNYQKKRPVSTELLIMNY